MFQSGTQGAGPGVKASSELETWLEALRYLQDEHSSKLRRLGQSFLSYISGFAYEAEKERFTCRCQGRHSEPYLVVINLDFEAGFVDATCSCPRGVYDLCEHTSAAVSRLLSELKQPQSPLTRSFHEARGRAVWAAALSELDRYLEAKQPVSPMASDPAVRLNWRILYATSGVELAAYEQTRTKAGGWTKGRKLSWERLAHEKKLWTTPADQHAASKVQQYRSESGYYYGAYWGIDEFAALESLVGHPVVTWADAPEQSVEIVRGRIGLVIEPAPEGLKLAMALDGRPILSFTKILLVGGHGVVGFDRKANRISLARTDEHQAALLEKIHQQRPTFPPEAEPELLARLPALEQSLPVQLPEKLQGETVPADARVHLLLRPSAADGLTVSLQMRPAPEGAYCFPGEGPPELTGIKEGKRVRVQRQLHAEIEHANRIAGELNLARYLSSDRWQWSLPSDDDALDLLALVRTRPADDPVVEWPDNSLGMTVIGEVTPAALQLEITDKRDWFGLEGTIELDGRKFPLVDLLNALKSGRRYLQLADGQWAAISEAFRERLAALDDLLHRHRGELEFNTTAAPVLTDLLDDHVVLKATQAWEKAIARLEEAVELDPQPPISLTAELRDYQLEGYRWLRRLAAWGVGGCLADDMGLGKTVQALAVLLDRMEEGPALVVAPTSVGFNWAREAERFAPALHPIIYRDTDRSEFLATLQGGDLVIASYGLLLRHAEELAQVRWGTLVLDEAQFIKNSQTKTARSVYKLDADWRLALTGTPLENHLGELWSIFRAISPGLFGSRDRFRERFADPIEKRKELPRKQALARTIRPFILRRTKAEVLSELPQRTEVQLMAELSATERKLYEDARLWAITHLANAIDYKEDHRFQVLAALTRLRQLACHPRLIDDKWDKSSAKLDLFLETVDELREGRHRALVFSQFTQHLALLRAALDERNIRYQYLDGQTTPKQREERVDAFQRGEGELFLISLKAGGTGLNLTAADYVIHMDPWWNPAVEDQATDRAHRIGQTRPVVVYRLVTKDTIEEQILALHGEKRNLVAGVLEGSDQAAKLSTEELIRLIRDGGRSTPAKSPVG